MCLGGTRLRRRAHVDSTAPRLRPRGSAALEFAAARLLRSHVEARKNVETAPSATRGATAAIAFVAARGASAWVTAGERVAHDPRERARSHPADVARAGASPGGRRPRDSGPARRAPRVIVSQGSTIAGERGLDPTSPADSPVVVAPCRPTRHSASPRGQHLERPRERPGGRRPARPPATIGRGRDDAAARPSSWRRSGPSSPGSVITFDPDALAPPRRARAAMGEPGFWDDQAGRAASRPSTRGSPSGLERYERLQREHDDAAELLELEADGRSRRDRRAARGRSAPSSSGCRRTRSSTASTTRGDAVVSLHAGAGGTDAQDWAEMLLRMYLRWADDRGFQAELVEASPGGGGGPQVRDVHRQGRERLRDAQGRARRAPARPAQPVRQRAPPPHRVRPGRRRAAPARRGAVEIDEGDLRIDTYRAAARAAST